MAIEINTCLGEADIPKWKTKGKTTLIPKDPDKPSAPPNYRSRACLKMMWKILTSQIREDICDSFISHRQFPEEQKECRKRTRETEALLNIDQHILNRVQDETKN